MRARMLLAAAATLAALAVSLPVGNARAHDMNAMHHMGGAGDSGAMGQMGAHMEMGPHMTMTESRAPTEQDLERARELLKTLRAAIGKYQDSNVALADGYVPFLPTVPQDVYHFTNYSNAAMEYSRHFDAARPGSLLYTKHAFGNYRLVGAMYSAPVDMTPSELDEIVPLSVARWHVHTNVCLPKGITLGDLIRGNIGARDPHLVGAFGRHGDNFMGRRADPRLGFLADGRFGFTGTIADPAECEAAGGDFIKQAFGWMVHVYPFAGDDLKVAYGTSVP